MDGLLSGVVLVHGASRAHNRRMAENITPAVPVRYTSDARPRSTGCYVCRFHGGELDNGHIVCAGPDGRTIGYAARGCAYWQREPGADDE